MIMLKKPTLKSDRIFLVILLIAIICILYAPRVVFAAYNDALGFKTAAELLNRGMYLESLAMYQDIDRYSDNTNNRARAILYMGTTYALFLDQHDTALKHFKKIIRDYPDSQATPDALFNSGTVLYESGKFEKASLAFKRYIERYPGGRRIQSAEIWAASSIARISERKVKTVPEFKLHIPDMTIRVLIRKNAETITVKSDGAIEVLNPVSGKRYYSGYEPALFSKSGEHLVLNGKRLDFHQCRIESDSTAVTINDRRFRGNLIISVNSKGLSAINHIPVEQYLYGVVPKEMSPSWPKDALMAQAVASRTYALYVKGKSSGKTYDVVSTTTSQVYRGFDVEAIESNSAVDATHGQVITYNGKLIVAYFHSSSGGHTEDAKNVWSADLPYLKGAPDRFSDNSPGGTWEFVLSNESLKNRLNRYGLNVGQVDKLTSVGKSRSRRVLNVSVLSDKGNCTLRSNSFRIKVGATTLKSTLFHIQPNANGFIIKGRGYGHGVGMSQYGAKKMAQKGFNYRDILKQYYKDIKIVTLGIRTKRNAQN